MKWKVIGGVAVAFLVGLGAGAVGADQSKEIEVLKSDRKQQVASLREQIAEAQESGAAAQGRADQANEEARTAEARAERTAKRKLANRERRLERRAAELDEREARVTGLETAWEEGTIPGDGRFRVGSDVQPGVYQAETPTSGNCYWARLGSDTGELGDIIDNGNVAGPVTITVGAGDALLELSGCEEFHKVG
jgi:septal ring factor EnvC (AmiA/AmiB activator)